MASTDGEAPNVAGERKDADAGGLFPIVGVGASAGGLEAFVQLLGALPLDTGMGFVLVQHLDPDHESQLARILARSTSLPVREITQDDQVQPNHVYVIPPDTNLSISNGVLKIERRARTRTPPRPIDSFFESLAVDRRERAIGVVLSGTATDGTIGLEAIKGEGGITFAQDGTAKHESMPRSAVAAGCVDLMLSPAAIATELTRIAKHPFVGGRGLLVPPEAEPALPAVKKEEDGYKKVLLLLRNHSGVDFSQYKSSTIQRRIARRVVISKQVTLDAYARFLRGNAWELDALYSDVLISVTSFFRNPEVFEVVQEKVLPELLARPGSDPLRCWVLGCSTGQEAYSIAIAFTELAERTPRLRKLQIFATDLNEALLEKARHGLYARSLAQDVSPERLGRFFVEEEGGYRVSKALREMVVFARQNLIADPPFSRMDLISCRNLLIYLEPSLQRKAFPTFHYALGSGGFLLLGASESIGGFTDLFEPADKKHRIFVRKPAPTSVLRLPLRREMGDGAVGRRLPMPEPPPGEGAQPEGLRDQDAQREADRVTVNKFAPPAVLVNADLQVLQFRGSTGAYLEPPVGRATFDVLKMAREGVMLPLRSLINQAKKENRAVRRENVRVERDDQVRSVNLEVIPLKNLTERCFLILFEEPEAAVAGGERPRPPPPERAPAADEASRVAELELELAEMREYLEAMREQQDAANEEVQSANEEVQSTNEELLSINEELETSKEELESANEELTTVNEEMSNRNVELVRLNNDLINLQISTKLPIVLLGRDLTIRRFSQQAEKQFDLLAADIGRPITGIRHGLVHVEAVPPAGDPRAGVPTSREVQLDLEAVVGQVIADVREQEREVLDKDRRWSLLRVRPYLTLDNRVDGAVLVLTDIDKLKRGEQIVAAARDYAENTLDTVREPLLVLDEALRVEAANRSFLRTFGLTRVDTMGRPIYELGNRQWDIPRLREVLAQITLTNKTIEGFEVEQEFEELGRRSMVFNARLIQQAQREGQHILLAIEDITIRKRAEEAVREHLKEDAVQARGAADRLTIELRKNEERLKKYADDLAAADERKNEFLAMLGHELRNPLTALAHGLHLLDRITDNPQRSAEVRAMMSRQTKRITSQLDQLLDIARFISNRVELTKHHFDLVHSIRAAVETVMPMVEEQQQELTVKAPPDGTVFVNGDVFRLTQVVENLLTNASKYTNQGGHIALTVEADDAQVRIVVRDDGMGMTPEFLPHVFEIFTQAPRSLDRAKGGLGLGLPLVRRLAEMHGGKVSAASAGLDQGCEFLVTLPRAGETMPGAKASRKPAHVEHRRPRRILVVEDERDAAEALTEFLRIEGHEVSVAHSGSRALEAARAFKPEIVLLDLGLPEMDGYEVASRLRAEHGQTMRVIAVTGYRADPARLKRGGFDAHLIKPPEMRALVALLDGGNSELPPGKR